jgi:ATP-dependent DNA helicase RecQ
VLLLYFGDKVLNTCGVCDICLEQLRRSPNDDVIDSITEELLQVLSDAHFTLDELVPALRHGTEKQRVDVIRFLLDSGKIKCDGKTYYL